MNLDDVTVIRVERENAGDDEVRLLQWAVTPGEVVAPGQLLGEMETSKAVFEIRAERAGHVFYRVQPGEMARVGEVLAVITASSGSVPSLAAGGPLESRSMPDKGEPRFSRAASALIAEHGLDNASFSGAGLVTRADVEQRLAKKERPWSKSSQEVLILGGGGHARCLIDLLRLVKSFEIAGIAASDLAEGTLILGVPVLGKDTELERFYRQGYRFFVNGVGAIDQHRVRWRLYVNLKEQGFFLPNLIHPDSSVASTAALGEGNQVFAQAMVGSGVRIANNCIVNSGAVISHDSVLYDNVHVAPGALIAGGVEIGPDTLIGMGVKVYRNVRIGGGVVIFNGCTIHRDIPDGTIVRSDP